MLLHKLMQEASEGSDGGSAAPSDGPADSGQQQPTPGEGGTPSPAEGKQASTGKGQASPPAGEGGTPGEGKGSGEGGDTENAEATAKKERRNSFQKRISEKTQQARDANERAEAAERRAAAAEAALQAAQQGPDGQPLPNQGIGDFPTLEQYNYDQAQYQQAVIEYNAKLTSQSVDSAMARQARTRAVEAQRDAQTAIIDTFKERSAAFADDGHPDYYAKVANAGFAKHVTQGCVLAENGAQVAYHLANNPDLVAQLNSLPAPAAMMQLGTISAQFSAPVAPRQSRTPPPADPPTGGQGGKVTKDPDKMSPNEYAKSRGYRK